MNIRVYVVINRKKIRCEVLSAFRNSETGRSYVIIFSPLSVKDCEVFIPLLFDPNKSNQKASFITDEQDRSVIETVINTNVCEIQYSLDDTISFEVCVLQTLDDTTKDTTSELIKRLQSPLTPPPNIDELIKNIDAKIAHLAGEEFFSKLEKNETTESSLAAGLILSIVENDILFTHIPLDIIDTLISSNEITISPEEMSLFKAFENILIALGKSEVVYQDVEDALVAFAECKNCTRNLFNTIIKHKTFAEMLPRDVLQSVHCNIVLRVPYFFNSTDVRFAANYYYAKKEYDNAIKLYQILYEIIVADEQQAKEQANVFNSIGCCYVGNMQFEEACQAFKRATDIDSKFAAAYNNWAYTLIVECDTLVDEDMRQKKLQDALVYINDALQLNKDDVSFISNKAFIEFELGQYTHVLRDYNRAKELSKKYSDISTILKLTIDSRIRLSIISPQHYQISFDELYDDLCFIYNNENGGNKYYFEALDVYNKIIDCESVENAKAVVFELILLEFYIKELLSSIAVRNPHQKVYYYTNMRSLQKILCDEDSSVKYRLPIFSSNHMNDPSEGHELEKVLLQSVEDINMVQDLFNNSAQLTCSNRRRLESDFTFLKSFSKNDDSLPMWVHYADSGKGCCVKVSPRFFTNFDIDLSDNEKTLTTNPFDNEYRLFEIIYVRNGEIVNCVPSKVNELYESMIHKFASISSLYNYLSKDTQNIIILAISKIISKLKYLFKSVDYFYEQEMRVVLKRPLLDLKRDDIDIQFTSATNDNPIPKVFVYTNKSLLIEEIIFGPKVSETDDMIPFLAMKLLKINDYKADKVTITKSLIEYR